MDNKILLVILLLVSLLAIFARYDYETGGTMTGKYIPVPPNMKTHAEIVAEREAEAAAEAAEQLEALTPPDTTQTEEGGTETGAGEEGEELESEEITLSWYIMGGVIVLAAIFLLWRMLGNN